VNDRFIREAAKESGIDYEVRLNDYSPLPFTANAEDTGAPVAEPRLAGQIWIKGESKVRLFSTPEAAFAAVRKVESAGKALRVVYVHDRESGLKLFADKVWNTHRKTPKLH
jgi:NitT/TauT family transport system substrate-binding protein